MFKIKKGIYKKVIIFFIIIFCTCNYYSTTVQSQEPTTIIISEIFPNPKGQDKNQEWIELYNQSNVEIKLQNWKIKVNEKETIIKSEIKIPAKGFIILESEKIKFSLLNQSTTIELLNEASTLVDKLKYDKPPENKSYQIIQIKDSNNKIKSLWRWGDSNKKAIQNNFFFTEGTISQKGKLGEKSYFTITGEKGNTFKVNFSIDNIDPDTYENFIQIGDKISLIGEIKNQTIWLYSYKITEQNSTSEQGKANNFIATINSTTKIITFILLASALILIIKVNPPQKHSSNKFKTTSRH